MFVAVKKQIYYHVICYITYIPCLLYNQRHLTNVAKFECDGMTDYSLYMYIYTSVNEKWGMHAKGVGKKGVCGSWGREGWVLWNQIWIIMCPPWIVKHDCQVGHSYRRWNEIVLVNVYTYRHVYV